MGGDMGDVGVFEIGDEIVIVPLIFSSFSSEYELERNSVRSGFILLLELIEVDGFVCFLLGFCFC